MMDTNCVSSEGIVTFKSNGIVTGRINERYRRDGQLHEFYIENGNLIEYNCYEGSMWQCKDEVEQRIYYPQQ